MSKQLLATNSESSRQTTTEGAAIPPSQNRLQSLDGLRAISIALVLLGHLNGTRGFIRADLGIGDYAHLGVTVFFVISGFLITSLLISEYQKTGQISLKMFYARRALRIFPASYFYLACILMLWILGIFHWSGRALIYAATYTVNYVPSPPWQLGHLWSLSVEEQFYLVWPFAVAICKPRKAMWFALAALAIGPFSRALQRLLFLGTPYRDLALFPVVADSLATGCLLAWARGWLEDQRWYLQLFKPAVSLALLASLFTINRYAGYTVVAVLGGSATNLIIAILVHRSVHIYDDLMGKILNWKPVAFVGLLSYSLYLWQQPFLDRGSSAWINAFPQNVIFAVLAAMASYLFLEKPLLRLRTRLRNQ